jgi:hypothetical protein
MSLSTDHSLKGMLYNNIYLFLSISTVILTGFGLSLSNSYTVALFNLMKTTYTKTDLERLQAEYSFTNISSSVILLFTAIACIASIYVLVKLIGLIYTYYISLSVVNNNTPVNTPSGAVWGYFIPGLNLYRPFKNLNEMITNSRISRLNPEIIRLILFYGLSLIVAFGANLSTFVVPNLSGFGFGLMVIVQIATSYQFWKVISEIIKVQDIAIPEIKTEPIIDTLSTQEPIRIIQRI